MAYALLGMFADKARYPAAPPDFQIYVGWMCFALVAALLLWAWTRAESVRRALLALEDPRTFAVLRIGFALMTIVCFLNLAPYWRMLFSDEGIFDLAYAQDRLGRTALRGWTPEDGFFDGWAVLCFLWNKPSLLYMHGSTEFVVWHMLIMFAVLLLYAAGVGTRVMGVIAWLLVSSVYNRNALYWEGTDTVYRAFWFILLFAKTGHAWSFDNWLRCRFLRKKGMLDDPAHPPEEGDTRVRQPIYRLVPSWPRYLFMLQLAAIYIATGVVKTGDVWAKGDALYYALNMDHFYRFEYATQVVSSVFATNVFRLMTWVTHWWERLFPLVLVGVILRFGVVHRDEPWYRAQHRGWRLWLGRAALVGAYALAYRLVVIVVPYCLPMVKDEPADATGKLRTVHLVFGIVIPLLVVAWFALGRWPLRLLRGGRPLGPITRKFPRIRIPEIRIEQDSLRAWLVGRRVWLTLGFMFHGFLILFMNIGMFPFIMLMPYVGFLAGDEVVKLFRNCVAWLRGRKRLAKLAPPALDRALADAEASTDVRPRGRKFPDLVVLVFGLGGAWLVKAKAAKEPWIGTATWWWLGAIVVVALALRFMRPTPRDVAAARQPGPALAYGALGRSLALFAFCWHTLAVGIHLFPSFSVFNAWRSPTRSLFGSWLMGTGTSQSWEMFAPNPPRSNTFMKSVVVEHDGTRWDLRNNSFEYRPNPWIWNDRMRKMHRRMIGKGKWYLRYWVDYHCRDWALRTGEVPKEMEIWSINTRIPPPDFVSMWQPAKQKGRRDANTGAVSGQPYHPRRLRVKEDLVQTHACGKGGQLPLEMKERYGWPITDEDRERAAAETQKLERQYASRRQTWDNRTDWGQWGESIEERRARTEQSKRERAAEDLEQRIEQATPEAGPETPAEPQDGGQDEERGDDGEIE
jgi:hypothetical protein